MNLLQKNNFEIPNIEMTLREFLTYFKRYPVIALTWPAGAGKTTLTRALQNYLSASVFTEVTQDNPFLKIIQETGWKVNDITLWTNNQNYFLATDVWEITKGFLQAQKNPVIFDFALTQPFIYADIKLHGNALKSFNAMFEEQFSSLPKPDIIIEIQVCDDTLIQRIQNRGTFIDEHIIQMVWELNSYYKKWIVWDTFHSPETKIIILNNDIPLNPDQLQEKIQETIQWFL